MNSELSAVIATVKQKTGIGVEIVNPMASQDISDNVSYSLNRLQSGNVFVDEQGSDTYFKFRFKDFDYVGKISGATNIEKNYAYLMISYIENNAKDMNFGKTEGLRNIILGDYTKSQTLRFIRKYGLEDVKCCVVLITLQKNASNDLLEFLASFMPNGLDESVGIDDKTVALVKFMKSSSVYESLSEFLQMLSDNISEELNIEPKIAVGGIVPTLAEANISFLQAQSTIKMSNVFFKKSNIHTYKEYTLVRMLEELPKFKIEEYLDVLIDKDCSDLFSDEDMMKTCEEFLDDDLNISETSRKLFMHRNTLMYRLDKVEAKTGLNIRNFQDAVTFRLITILKKLNSQR